MCKILYNCAAFNVDEVQKKFYQNKNQHIHERNDGLEFFRAESSNPMLITS